MGQARRKGNFEQRKKDAILGRGLCKLDGLFHPVDDQIFLYLFDVLVFAVKGTATRIAHDVYIKNTREIVSLTANELRLGLKAAADHQVALGIREPHGVLAEAAPSYKMDAYLARLGAALAAMKEGLPESLVQINGDANTVSRDVLRGMARARLIESPGATGLWPLSFDFDDVLAQLNIIEALGGEEESDT